MPARVPRPNILSKGNAQGSSPLTVSKVAAAGIGDMTVKQMNDHIANRVRTEQSALQYNANKEYVNPLVDKVIKAKR